MNLHQFSFTKYDTNNWGLVMLGTSSYPCCEEDGECVIITKDDNFCDVVVHYDQQDLIQQCYTKFANKLAEREGFEFTLDCEPNYYGSIYMAWRCAPENLDRLVCFLTKYLVDQDEENICYWDEMPNEYEELVNAYQVVNMVDVLVDQGLAETEEEAREAYVSACNVLMFDPTEE